MSFAWDPDHPGCAPETCGGMRLDPCSTVGRTGGRWHDGEVPATAALAVAEVLGDHMWADDLSDCACGESFFSAPDGFAAWAAHVSSLVVAVLADWLRAQQLPTGHGWCRYEAADLLGRQAPCPTCSGPSRETVGMVCPTCGIDHAPEPVRVDPVAGHLALALEVLPAEPPLPGDAWPRLGDAQAQWHLMQAQIHDMRANLSYPQIETSGGSNA